MGFNRLDEHHGDERLIRCHVCGGTTTECGPMKSETFEYQLNPDVPEEGTDRHTEWIGLRHLPNLGKLAERRQGGR